MKPADVAIQIVNYKSKAYLEPLLESIVSDNKDSSLRVEIHILDNASGDDLTDIGKKWQKYNVHTYAAKRNGGFGYGHNFLATKSTARYLLLLNPDMLFMEKGTVARLLKTLEQTNAAVVGPRLLIPKTRNNKPGNLLPREELKQQLWDCGTFNLIVFYQPISETSEVAWVSGGVCFIARKWFEAVGGFDESYFMYWEDVDICYRLHAQGARIVYDPHIEVLHYGTASSSLNFKNKQLAKGFFRFHGSRLKRSLG